jgi:tetratricopeptide (TPR) repeat protein
MKVRFLLFPLLLAATLMTGCAKPIPEASGIYLRHARDWSKLARIPITQLKIQQPTDLNALRAAVQISATDEPRLVFVGEQPRQVSAFQRSGEGWAPFTVAAAPAEGRSNAWQLQFPKPAPRGMILLQLDASRAVAFVNGPDALYSYALGAAYAQAGHAAAAESAFEAAIDADDHFAPAKNALARVFAKQKKEIGKAKELANSAIGLAASDPEKALYFDTLGEVYFADDQIEKGIESIDRAIGLDLKNPQFHLHLNNLIEKAQKEPPETVLKRFYELIGNGEYKDAAKLANDFDVDRLKEADQLESTLKTMAQGGPFQEVILQNTVKHGKVTYFKYLLAGKDGSRRNEDIQLQFQKNEWRVSLQ